MTPEERKDYSLICLYRSVETLQEARMLYEGNLFFGTANRIYYSLFYSVSALALVQGYSTSKHTGIQSWFNKELVKKNLISPELGKLYNTAFEFRMKSDYSGYKDINREIVRMLLDSAPIFIDELSRMTHQKIQIMQSESEE